MTSNFSFNAAEFGSSVIPSAGCAGTTCNANAAASKYVSLGGGRKSRRRMMRHKGGKNISSYSTIGTHTMGSVIGAKTGYSGLVTNNEVLTSVQRPLNPFSKIKMGGGRKKSTHKKRSTHKKMSTHKKNSSHKKKSHKKKSHKRHHYRGGSIQQLQPSFIQGLLKGTAVPSALANPPPLSAISKCGGNL